MPTMGSSEMQQAKRLGWQIMTDFDDKIDFEHYGQSNKRISIRYRVENITGTIKFKKLIFKKEAAIKILNISSKGAAIISKEKLSRKNRVTLIIQLGDEMDREIGAVVVHANDPIYGIKFNQSQADIIDYLMETQTKLEMV